MIGRSPILAFLLVVACFSISGTIVYYATVVNALTLGIAAILTIGAILFARRKRDPLQLPLEKGEGRSEPASFVLLAITAISIAAWWQAILSAPITDAVRSPWLVLSPFSIIAPAVALVVSFVLLHRGAKSLGSIALFATLFSIFASSAILFPLGYGFDPFLHRATVAHIIEHGTITPKPLYYIGQYALELYGNILGGIPLFFLDTLLVPFLAAITLTFAARKLPIGIALLLIGFGNFIATTPQSLAYLFSILVVITIPKSITKIHDLIAPGIFAIAAVITHPIAGVPTCFFILLSATHLMPSVNIRSVLRWIVGVLAAISLPAMFAIQAMLSHADVSFSLSNLLKLSDLPLTGFLFSHGNTWLDALYLVINNLPLLIIALAIIGIILNHRSPKHDRMSTDSAIMMTALIASFVIVSLGINFSYLIDYERQDFALRLLFIATLFAIPFADHALSAFANLATDRTRRAPIIALLFIVSCAVIYGAYPRHDGYARSAAFNVSQADIDTVYAIHNREADDANYIVLSNQATASAALQEFGFRKYYHNDIFYYPIPTGGALYQSYLSMVNEAPTAATVNEAMRLAGVHKAYFVVSEYWWNSTAIIENAKQQTEYWFAVDGGKTTVFVFTDEVSAQ